MHRPGVLAIGLEVALRVNAQPRPRQALAHLLAQDGIVFTNAAAKGDQIQPTQAGRERPSFTNHPVGKLVNGPRGIGIALRRLAAQGAHIGRNARHPQQARLFVKQLFNALGIPALLQQIEQHPCIQATAARTHHQAIKGRKAHGGGHTDTTNSGAQAGPIAQVGHHHPAPASDGLLLQHGHDVLVGQAVKTVAAHTLGLQRFGQGKGVIHFRHLGVEGRIKASNLRHLRKGLAKLANALQVVRLVQRCQRIKARQLLQHRIGHTHTGTKNPATMHHPVGHGIQALCLRQLLHQAAQAGQRYLKWSTIGRHHNGFFVFFTLMLPSQNRLPARLQPFKIARHRVRQHLPTFVGMQGKLQRGRACIDRQNGHGCAP